MTESKTLSPPFMPKLPAPEILRVMGQTMFRELNARYGGIRYRRWGRKREMFPSVKVFEAISRHNGANPRLAPNDLLRAFESVAASKGFHWQSLVGKWHDRWLQWFVDVDANLRWLAPDSDLRSLIHPYGDKTMVKGARNILWLFESFIISSLPAKLHVFQVGHEGSVGWRWSADSECARWSALTNEMPNRPRLVVGEVQNTDIIYLRSTEATYAEMIIDPADVVRLSIHDVQPLYPFCVESGGGLSTTVSTIATHGLGLSMRLENLGGGQS